jgi:hypothetical protein
VRVWRLAPSGNATGELPWLTRFFVGGLGAGIALGGLMVETAGLRAAFVAGSAVVSTMALVALAISPQPVRATAG